MVEKRAPIVILTKLNYTIEVLIKQHNLHVEAMCAQKAEEEPEKISPSQCFSRVVLL